MDARGETAEAARGLGELLRCICGSVLHGADWAHLNQARFRLHIRMVVRSPQYERTLHLKWLQTLACLNVHQQGLTEPRVARRRLGTSSGRVQMCPPGSLQRSNRPSNPPTLSNKRWTRPAPRDLLQLVEMCKPRLSLALPQGLKTQQTASGREGPHPVAGRQQMIELCPRCTLLLPQAHLVTGRAQSTQRGSQATRIRRAGRIIPAPPTSGMRQIPGMRGTLGPSPGQPLAVQQASQSHRYNSGILRTSK